MTKTRIIIAAVLAVVVAVGVATFLFIPRGPAMPECCGEMPQAPTAAGRLVTVTTACFPEVSSKTITDSGRTVKLHIPYSVAWDTRQEGAPVFMDEVSNAFASLGFDPSARAMFGSSSSDSGLVTVENGQYTISWLMGNSAAPGEPVHIADQWLDFTFTVKPGVV